MSGHGVVDGHGERPEIILVYESPDMGGSEQPEAFFGREVFELALRHDAILDRGARQPRRPKAPSLHIRDGRPRSLALVRAQGQFFDGRADSVSGRQCRADSVGLTGFEPATT